MQSWQLISSMWTCRVFQGPRSHWRHFKTKATACFGPFLQQNIIRVLLAFPALNIFNVFVVPCHYRTTNSKRHCRGREHTFNAQQDVHAEEPVSQHHLQAVRHAERAQRCTDARVHAAVVHLAAGNALLLFLQGPGHELVELRVCFQILCAAAASYPQEDGACMLADAELLKIRCLEQRKQARLVHVGVKCVQDAYKNE
jgi:hypothetical protein